jgi:hypothetical protein
MRGGKFLDSSRRYYIVNIVFFIERTERSFPRTHERSIRDFVICLVFYGPGYFSRYSDWLRVGRSGNRIPVGARFFTHFQTGPRAHPASCIMDIKFIPWVKWPSRGVDHPHLSVPWSRKRRAIFLPPPPLGLRVSYGVPLTCFLIFF